MSIDAPTTATSGRQVRLVLVLVASALLVALLWTVVGNPRPDVRLDGMGAVGMPAAVGEAVTFSGGELYNEGPNPVRVLRVTPIWREPPGDAVAVVGVGLLAGSRQVRIATAADWPPRDAPGDEEPYGPHLFDLEDLVLEPGPARSPPTFAGILLGLEPREPWRFSIVEKLEVEVEDVVTGRRRTSTVEGKLMLCAVPSPADLDAPFCDEQWWSTTG